jgi:hypothetical protein
MTKNKTHNLTHNLTATVELNMAQRLHSVSERRIVESYLSAWLEAKSQEDKLAELLTIPSIIPGCTR